jgi:hypothetical protein
MTEQLLCKCMSPLVFVLVFALCRLYPRVYLRLAFRKCNRQLNKELKRNDLFSQIWLQHHFMIIQLTLWNVSYITSELLSLWTFSIACSVYSSGRWTKTINAVILCVTEPSEPFRVYLLLICLWYKPENIFLPLSVESCCVFIKLVLCDAVNRNKVS